MNNSLHAGVLRGLEQDLGIGHRLRMCEKPMIEPDPVGGIGSKRECLRNDSVSFADSAKLNGNARTLSPKGFSRFTELVSVITSDPRCSSRCVM